MTGSGLSAGTALHIAALTNNIALVSAILSTSMAHLEMPSNKEDGWTPLHAAVVGNHTEVVQLLLEAQSDPNCRELVRNEPPLHSAARQDTVAVLELLLVAGADIDATNKDMETPLHVAASNRCKDIVNTLIDCGANVRLRNGNGKTAMEIAITLDDVRDALIVPPPLEWRKAEEDDARKTYGIPMPPTPLDNLANLTLEAPSGDCLRIDGAPAFGSFLNGQYFRLIGVEFNARPVYEFERIVHGPPAWLVGGKHLYLFYHQRNRAWVIGMKVSVSMGCIAYRMSDQDRPDKVSLGDCNVWCASTLKGNFERCNQMTCECAHGRGHIPGPYFVIDSSGESVSDGKPGRRAAEDLLRKCRHYLPTSSGYYSLRISSSIPDAHVLSVLMPHGGIEHILITYGKIDERPQESQYVLLELGREQSGPSALSFESLETVIDHCIDCGVKTSGGQVKLTKCIQGSELLQGKYPVADSELMSQSMPPPLDRTMSRNEAEALLRSKFVESSAINVGFYILRRSASVPKAVVISTLLLPDIIEHILVDVHHAGGWHVHVGFVPGEEYSTFSKFSDVLQYGKQEGFLSHGIQIQLTDCLTGMEILDDID